MLLTIEFGKLFRRKFNYLFAIILILMNFTFVYKLDSLSSYYDISIINKQSIDNLSGEIEKFKV